MIKLTQEDYNILFTALELYASDISLDKHNLSVSEKQSLLGDIERLQDKLEIY